MFLLSQTWQINLIFRVQIQQKYQFFRVQANKNTKSVFWDVRIFRNMRNQFDFFEFKFGKNIKFFELRLTKNYLVCFST